MDEQITFFGETDARNKRLRFGIKAKDRTRHVYVIGKTGMGKSTLLENMAIQDIQNGNGLAFIDPHGKTAELLLEYVPESRIKDVLYFAPFDMEYPVSFNVMEDVGPDKRHLVANGLMSAFKKIWVDAWSARMEYILNNILLALLEYPESTLLGVNRMLADKDYRNKVVANISDPSVKSFWVDEFAKYGEKYMQEAGAAIQNKIGQFVSNPLVRNIIGQSKSSFDIRKMMDESKILIVNLSKGQVGESNANLLGGMLITKIYLGAMSRADVHDAGLQKLPNFYLFVDEFQNFANESFADILSEARKYKLNLTIAHQYIEQMTEEVRAAVFGNVGSMITFRVGAYDAEVLEKEFLPTFTAEDLVNLDKFQIYLKLMIDGVGSQPFSARTINNPPEPERKYLSEIVDASRAQFARPRLLVEEDIKNWHRPIDVVEKDRKSQPQQNGKPGFNTHPPFPPKNKDTQFPRREQPQSPQHIQPQPRVEAKKQTPTPVLHNPFKKALQDKIIEDDQQISANRETELRKALSLSFLKKDEPKKTEGHQEERKDKKGITQESLSDLRSALKSVLAEAGISSETKKSEPPKLRAPVQAPVQKKEEKPAEVKAVSSGPAKPVSPRPIKEIPEDELRNLLSVEE